MKNTLQSPPIKYIMQFMLLVLIPSLVTCTSEPEPDDAQNNIGNDISENIYRISPEQFRTAGMTLGKLVLHEFPKTIKATGMLEVPPRNKAAVGAFYLGGYVTYVNLLPGEWVRKGQVLLTLDNPDYIQLQQDFLEAKGQLRYLRSDYERQENLSRDSIVSQKAFLKAESEYNVTRVRYESLRKKLSLLNLDPDSLTVENMRSSMTVTAPISGYVTEVNTTRGKFLGPTDIAISLINTDHLHLELALFEKDLSAVAIGQPITFRISGDESNEYGAEVHLINKSVNPETRMVHLHCHLDDEGNIPALNPGMYVEAEITTSSTKAYSLPREAIVNVEERHFVLVRKRSAGDTLSFERKQALIGISTEEFVEVLNHDDFPEETEFMYKGAFDLITE